MNYHDALAKLGVGVAHPGGHATTQQWIAMVPWKHISNVVEIGCGTGRTACYLAAQHNVSVTGYDSRRLMVEKAEIRAREQGLQNKVKFFVADAHSLPLPSQSVDLVYMESVAVFMHPEVLYPEICRILRPGGKLVDVEMTRRSQIPTTVLQEIKSFYGAQQVPNFQEWRNTLKKAGFIQVRNLLTAPVDLGLTDKLSGLENYDPHQIISVEPQEVLEIQKVLQRNIELMQKSASYLAYTVLLAVTPESE